MPIVMFSHVRARALLLPLTLFPDESNWLSNSLGHCFLHIIQGAHCSCKRELVISYKYIHKTTRVITNSLNTFANYFGLLLLKMFSRTALVNDIAAVVVDVAEVGAFALL